MDLEKLKFPIGKYIPNKNPNRETLSNWIKAIKDFPCKVKKATANLSIEQLNWKYRPEGWTIKQVVHHCADSHMNSIIRFKLALTEENPTIRPYFEDRWAELPDSLDDNISDAQTLLRGLHKKWVVVLNNISEEQLKLEFIHPEHGQSFNLAETIGNYAWHCNHHYAHIENSANFKGRFN